MEFKLKDKTAVITGASQGLGKAIAEEFIKEGANVIICARNDKQLLETMFDLNKLIVRPKQKILAIQADVSDTRSLDRLYRITMGKFRNIDILVNNAGIQGPTGLIEDINWKEWIESLNINLLGTVYMCQLFIPQFKKMGYGKIINISGGGAANPRAYFTAYATAKAAVVRFTESIADELRDYNVCCNSVAPGALNTRLFDEVLSRGPEKVGEEYYKKALKQKESGGSSLENAAQLCVFLASKESDGITGKLISAVWDDWRNDIPEHIDEIRNSDLYTLRRITPKDKNLKWGDIS